MLADLADSLKRDATGVVIEDHDRAAMLSATMKKSKNDGEDHRLSGQADSFYGEAVLP